ncbi:MAG: hydrolase [Halofilum sp. (in: g-proteobacteria)]|nr:hydrolase [Halofilum sp. (in: g-proteobacteria)]
MSTTGFRPHPLLRGAHAQTLYPFCIRPRWPLPWRRERLELPDGDFVDLRHLGARSGPIVCLFHGLEGCADSHYIAGLTRVLVHRGYRVTCMQFRGCSGEPNRLPRTYHSGDTGDIAFLLDTLRTRHPDRTLTAVGFSLGGNALLKYLGQRGTDVPLRAAAAISVPFRLAVAAGRIDRGLSRRYQAYLLERMKASTRARARRLGGLPIDLERMERARSFREFDDCVTAPLNGFRDVDDYYSRASSSLWLAGIEVPTLVLHARDDPFLGPDGVPLPAGTGPGVRLELSEHGGHVGFIAANRIGWPIRWLHRRIPAWLEEWQ